MLTDKQAKALKPGWKNEKHAAQWISTLETYVFPLLGRQYLLLFIGTNDAQQLTPVEHWIDILNVDTDRPNI